MKSYIEAKLNQWLIYFGINNYDHSFKYLELYEGLNYGMMQTMTINE